MGALNVANILQLTANGIAAGSAYALLGVAFGLILGVSGRFHVALTVSYTLAAFVAAWLGATPGPGLPFWLALGCGAAAAALAGIAMERFVYLPLSLTGARVGTNIFLMIFVASLGLSIAGRNALALSALQTPSLLISGFNNVGNNVGPVTITSLNIALVVTSWAAILILAVVLEKTALGRMIRAVRANPEMSLCVGINPRAIYLAVFAIGSFLAGIAAVFQATSTSATPDMGLIPLFYALVVAFVAGLSAPPLAVALTGLVIGLVESYSSLFLPTQWTTLVVFVILFVYVALRPLVEGGYFKRRARRPAPAVTHAQAEGS